MSGSPTRQSLVTSVAIKRPLTTGFRVLLIVVTLVAVAAAAKTPLRPLPGLSACRTGFRHSNSVSAAFGVAHGARGGRSNAGNGAHLLDWRSRYADRQQALELAAGQASQRGASLPLWLPPPALLPRLHRRCCCAQVSRPNFWPSSRRQPPSGIGYLATARCPPTNSPLLSVCAISQGLALLRAHGWEGVPAFDPRVPGFAFTTRKGKESAHRLLVHAQLVRYRSSTR